MTRNILAPEQMRNTYSRIPREDREPPPPRALIVAEHQCVQRWARRRLFHAGFEVFATDSAIDALRAAHDDPPDVIVVDHVVGWLDVRYLLTLLRRDERTARTPVLLITPQADGSLERVCRRTNAELVVRRKNGRTRSPGVMPANRSS